MFDWLFRRKKAEYINPEPEAPAEETEAPAETTEEPEAPAEEPEAPAEEPEAPAEEPEAAVEEPDAPAEEPEAAAEESEAPVEETEESEEEQEEMEPVTELTMPEQLEESIQTEIVGDPDAGCRKSGKKKKNRESKKDSGKKTKSHRKKSLYDWTFSEKKQERETAAGRTVTVRSLKLGEGGPAICVPLTGTGREELIRQAEAAVLTHPDLAEWRVDAFGTLDNLQEASAAVSELRACLGSIPLLFTVRTEPEGGSLPYDPAEYERLIRWGAGRPETDLIDIEVMHLEVDTEALCAFAHESGKIVVASAHFFDHTPRKDDLRRVFRREEACGADILKLAAMPQKAKDVLRLMSVSQQYHEETGAVLITMSMGEMGKISRISGRLTGSAVTFGTAGQSSAPGQIPAEELREILRIL